MEHKIHVFIADDHPLLRRGLRDTIADDPRLVVVGEAGDGELALTEIERLKPTVAVLDMDMPKLDGLGVAREIRKRKLSPRIVFLTIHDEEDALHAAMDLGAKGYLLKDTAMTEIVNAIRTVATGEHYVTPSLAARVLQRSRRIDDFASKQPGIRDLTPTERRILNMVADGQSSKEIGEELFIHYRTVENHRNNICQKLALRGPNALFKFAVQHKAEL